jgi:histidinol dehydrogenase
VISPDAALLEAVERAVTALVPQRPSVADASLALVHEPGVRAAVELANRMAPEHVELVGAEAEAAAPLISAAGCVFVGAGAAGAFGDYALGSNHVLPTSGTAAFSSGLNVTTFLRAIQVINYTESALQQVSSHIVSLSGAEDLPAHGDAVTARFRATGDKH